MTKMSVMNDINDIQQLLQTEELESLFENDNSVIVHKPNQLALCAIMSSSPQLENSRKAAATTR